MNKSNLKKTIAIGLAAMALFASFGCGSDEKKSSKSSGTSNIIALPGLNPQTPQQKAEAKEAWSQGKSYYKEGKYSEAVSAFTKAINAKEYNSYLYYERGRAYQELGDYSSAITDYTTAIEDGKRKLKQYEQDSNDSNKDFNIGATQLEMGWEYFNRGFCYQEQHDLINAIENYTKVIELYGAPGGLGGVKRSDCAAAYNNRGNCYSDKGDNARAVADYSKAIELESKKAMYYKNRSRAHQLLGNEAQAEADFTRARELEDNQ